MRLVLARRVPLLARPVPLPLARFAVLVRPAALPLARFAVLRPLVERVDVARDDVDPDAFERDDAVARDDVEREVARRVLERVPDAAFDSCFCA